MNANVHVSPPSNQVTPACRATFYLLIVLATYPLGAMAWLYLFVLRARLQLGRWPTPYQPDPKDLGLNFHYFTTEVALMSFPFASLACVCAILIARKCWRAFPTGRVLAFTIACAAYLIVMAIWDPGNFIEWFLD